MKLFYVKWLGTSFKIAVKKPLHFGLLLEGKGINQKKQNISNTSFSRSIRRNQDCNGQCNHLGAPASFMHFGLSFLFNLRLHKGPQARKLPEMNL